MFPLPQQDYTVMIVTATYNHVQYIEDTLKGIVMQQTDFPIVACVLDDCSTDGTTEIIRRYEALYPNLIKGFYFKENQYSQGKTTKEALIPWLDKVKYIASCEGDDYWTDPLKLQKQVDFMESHSDCSMSFHSVMEHWQDGCAPDKVFFPVKSKVYTGTEIYKQWVVATCSVMICSSVFKDSQMLDLFKNKGLMYYDQALFIYCSINGKIQGMHDVMGVYRRLKSGYSMQLEKDLKRSYQIIDQYCTHCQTMAEIFGKNLGPEFMRECEYRFVDTAVDGSLLACVNRDYKQAKHFFLFSFRSYAKDTLRLIVYKIWGRIKSKS